MTPLALRRPARSSAPLVEGDLAADPAPGGRWQFAARPHGVRASDLAAAS